MTDQMLAYNPDSRNPSDFTSPSAPLLRSTYALAKFLLTGKVLTPTYPFVKGFDVNHYHYCSDYPAAYAAGYRWVGIKCTEGTTVIDSKFSDQWSRALDAGFRIMPYHFFRCNFVGSDQADFFLNKISPLLDATLGKIMPPACDVETTDGMVLATRQSRFNVFMTDVDMVKDPCCYSSPSLWSTVMANMAMPWKNWKAHWTPNDYPADIGGWLNSNDITWQNGVHPTYAWAEHVPGVNEPIDTDRFFGTEDDLSMLVGDVELSVEQRLTDLENRVTELEEVVFPGATL